MATKIIIAGGTGALGYAIISHLQQVAGIHIVVLTRSPPESDGGVRYVQWDACTSGAWVEELEGSWAVINLVGKSVNCKYTEKNKQEIITSRVNATKAIGLAIQQANQPPAVWINVGSAAIFGDSGDVVKDENSAWGDGFSAAVCQQWEAAFHYYPTSSTRKVLLRAGLVFQKHIGFLQPFVHLVKAGLGGTIGTGRQYLSWIHEVDFVNIVQAVLFNTAYEGVIHGTSPEPVTNRHFMKALRTALGIPLGIPNPTVLVKLGSWFIQTEAELALSGRRVVSNLLPQKNFKFQYPKIEEALQQLFITEAFVLSLSC